MAGEMTIVGLASYTLWPLADGGPKQCQANHQCGCQGKVGKVSRPLLDSEPAVMVVWHHFKRRSAYALALALRTFITFATAAACLQLLHLRL